MRIRLHPCVWLIASLLLADGGAVQFRNRAGPFLVTVFTVPTPLRAGPADFTVLIQNAMDASPVLNATVSLRLSRQGEPDLMMEATRAQATNKLLYAAHPTLPSAGAWRLNLTVKSDGNTFDAAGDITVYPREAVLRTYWPYLSLAPVAVLLFAINQWLKTNPRRN